MSDVNEELIVDLENLLDMAREGTLTNLMYFADVPGTLVCGQRGEMSVSAMEDILSVVEAVYEEAADADDSDKAVRLVRG